MLRITFLALTRFGSGSKVTDSRVYSYEEIIECQEKPHDYDDFQFSIDDVEKEF